MAIRNSISDFKLSVRKRIIFHTGENDLIFHEGKLATEFGVSRTPVRQVLQSLAAEWLVEVKTGVGTIASPLRPERRSQDLLSFTAILFASGKIRADIDAADLDVNIFALKAALKKKPSPIDHDFFFDVSNSIASLLGVLVADEILRDALIAIYWRFIRRLVADAGGDLQDPFSVLNKIVGTIDAVSSDQSGQDILASIALVIEPLAREFERAEPL